MSSIHLEQAEISCIFKGFYYNEAKGWCIFMHTKPNRRVTLRHVAQETGYSVNTVSKALRDAADLSGQTKEYIRTTARRMGYVVNDMASALRSGFSNVLALIISDISNPFFGILCKEIEQQAARYNYTVIVFNTEEDALREERAIRTALSKNVDGVLLTPSQHSAEGITLLQDMGKPCVLIGRYFPDLQADAVLSDDEQGGYLTGGHLIDCGYRNLLMLNADGNTSAQDRAHGFTRAVAQTPNVKGRIITLKSPLGGCSDILRREYDEEPFDAIFAFSDLLAMEAVCALDQMGIPFGQIGVAGFDDIQSRLAIPMPLTSVGVDMFHYGKTLTDLLMRRIAGDMEDFPQRTVLPVALSVRKSTKTK